MVLTGTSALPGGGSSQLSFVGCASTLMGTVGLTHDRDHESSVGSPHAITVSPPGDAKDNYTILFNASGALALPRSYSE